MSSPKKFRGYNFTVEDWLALCEMHGNKCAQCGEEKPLCVDHIKPRAAGGTDDISNIQPVCKSCNSKKGSLFDGARRKYAEIGADPSLILRLPGDLHKALQAAATRDQRSLHGQIVYLLRKGLEEAGIEP